MNESRQQQMLAGQSSIAQKIFGYVPIQTSWSVSAIHGAVQAAKATGATAPAIRRALGELKDAGLIREPVAGRFQRDAATPKPKKEHVMTQVYRLRGGMDPADLPGRSAVAMAGSAAGYAGAEHRTG